MSMKLSRTIPLILSVTFSLLSTVQAADSTTLRIAHFWPAGSEINKDLVEAWAKTVEEESNGTLRVQNFPSQTLSSADDTYNATTQGIADIGLTVQGYTAGRFPLTQIVELPGVSTSATQGACILQSLYDDGYLGDEYKDSHVLFLFTTGPGYIHTQKTEVQKPSDLQGLRIRRPTAVVGDMLENLGAQPVGMPAPDIYTSMQRGVIDGVSLPWEGMKTFRLNELARQHTQVPFYSMAFVATMNKQTYERLTPEQQAVIDANAGMKWAEKAGAVFDRIDQAGRQEAVEAGDTIRVIDNPLENSDWQKPLQQGIDHYLSELESRGLDQARDVYQAALDAQPGCAAQGS